MITIFYAHPVPSRSRANRALIEAVRALEGVRIRALYDLYPDFSIDVAAEQEALAQSRLVVWQHPLYWYSPPALMKLWFEQVLAYGWAYGEGEQARALEGKDCLWVTTTGAGRAHYCAEGRHGHAFEVFVPPVRQIARFCGMRWLEPIVLHDARRDAAALAQAAAAYRAVLSSPRP